MRATRGRSSACTGTSHGALGYIRYIHYIRYIRYIRPTESSVVRSYTDDSRSSTHDEAHDEAHDQLQLFTQAMMNARASRICQRYTRRTAGCRPWLS